jgi:hypothetical protein
MLICTLTSAIAETGAKTTNVKNNNFKINFFIGLPPLFICPSFIRSLIAIGANCLMFDKTSLVRG